MLTKLSNRFYAGTRGWHILLVFVVLVGWMVVTLPGLTAVSHNIEGLDTMFFYTPDEAFANVAAYTAEARQAINQFHLTVDVVNPILYTAFLILLISWLFRRGFTPESKVRPLNIMPLGALLFDILENVFITIMMSAYPGQPRLVAWLATASTMAKFGFIYVSLALILVGLAGAIRRKFNKIVAGEPASAIK
ncbi:MAG: hypothetical protein CL608_08250 [Anaerolineaceae bacterium]|nr:hypothetical protein [Anaerolineaceae bacterium]